MRFPVPLTTFVSLKHGALTCRLVTKRTEVELYKLSVERAVAPRRKPLNVIRQAVAERPHWPRKA